MNQGGEPGHDDFGLPRVDIQIPDDARELDRDVQAYHRELRALRRHQRSLRWRTPLRHSGMIVPLIAGCLVLAMVAGMVLTMFSANPLFSGLAGERPQGHQPRTSGPPATGQHTTPAAPSAGGNAPGGPSTGLAARLPPGTINVAGEPINLSNVVGALAIIPAHCECARAVRRLVKQAMAVGVTVYLVGKRSSLTELNRLAPDAAAGGTAFVAIDADSVLNKAYQAKGLTVVLVDSQHTVRSAGALAPGFHLESTLKALRQTH